MHTIVASLSETICNLGSVVITLQINLLPKSYDIVETTPVS